MFLIIQIHLANISIIIDYSNYLRVRFRFFPDSLSFLCNLYYLRALETAIYINAYKIYMPIRLVKYVQ